MYNKLLAEEHHLIRVTNCSAIGLQRADGLEYRFAGWPTVAGVLPKQTRKQWRLVGRSLVCEFLKTPRWLLADWG